MFIHETEASQATILATTVCRWNPTHPGQSRPPQPVTSTREERMSLINDALKRAKEAQEVNPTPPPDLPFRAADPAPQRKFPLPMVLLCVVVGVFLMGGLLVAVALVKRASAPQIVTATQLPAPVQPLPEKEVSPVSDGPMAVSAVSAEVPSASTPDSTGGTEATPDPATATVTESAVAVPIEVPQPPVLKLQGIFYSPNRPSAIVNGKTVFLGNSVGELRVLAITRETVTLGSATQTNVLALDD